jgi:glucokinase
MSADRPPVTTRPGADRVIGVDLGGTKLLAGVVDRDLRVHARARRAAPREDPETLLDAVADVVAELRTQAGGEVRGVGYGIPCLLDADRRVAMSSTHLPLVGVPFAAAMAERTGLPVAVENDANLALLAEQRQGAAAGATDALMLTLGTGIGGAVMIGGALQRGARGAAGELGHMVVWADGPPCGPGCPSRGCLESLASGTALVREARRAAARHPDSGLGRAGAEGREIDGALVTELAAAGDGVAAAVLAEVGAWLGVGLVSLVNVFNPEVIVVGGGVSAAGELLLGPARAVVAARAQPMPGAPVRIATAHFGAESGMLGAAVLAYDSIDRRGS